MSLDAFDISFIEHEGTPQETLYDLLGLTASPDGAKKKRIAIRQYLEYKDKLPRDRQVGEMEKTVIKEDGSITSMRMLLLSEEESKSPQRIMQLMGFDVLQWTLITCEVQRRSYDVTMRMRQGEDENGKRLPDISEKKTNHAFSCKITVKPIQQLLNSEMIKQIFSELPSPNLCIYRTTKNSNKMLEFPIMDLHLGKLSWEDETGESWDLKIAERVFKKVIQDGIEKVKSYNIKPEKIIFPIGQDFFHFDTPRSTTTSGTIVDSDTRWQKMFAKGVELLVWAIENLRREAPIECMYVSGNHDKIFSYFLVYTLHAYFRNCDDVIIDISPTTRKYIQYGKNLIGYSHGAEEGKRIVNLMQIEMPQAWGETLFREWHLGHLHHEQAQEDAGVIVRKLSSVTFTDSWHKEKGFVGAIKKAQIFVWDKETGKDAIIDINVIGEFDD